MVITKIVLNLMTKWQLEFIGRSESQHLTQIAFVGSTMSSVNSCKTYIYMWSCSHETHFKLHERFFIPNYHFYRTDSFPGRKGGTAVAVRKGIPHNQVEPPPLVSTEATGVCIPICNSEVLLAAVYKLPGHAWHDADIVELLCFRHKSLLAGDLNAKHPFWNSVSNSSGVKLLNLRHIHKFEISAPQCPTH
jgi:hypothetical protein